MVCIFKEMNLWNLRPYLFPHLFRILFEKNSLIMDKKTLIALVLPSLLGASQMQAERTTNTPPQKDATTQTFRDLWKNVEQHRKQDLPQSALKVVNAIRQKAQKTNNTSHLIAAMLSTYQLEEEISSDSTQRVIEEMEQFCAADTHTVSRALWNFVLAQVLYQEYFPDNVFDGESIDIEDEIQDESAENIGEESENTQRQLARSLKYFRAAFEHQPSGGATPTSIYNRRCLFQTPIQRCRIYRTTRKVARPISPKSPRACCIAG